MRPGTLTRRLFLLTSLWAVIAVTLIAVVLTEAYQRNAERRFSELLLANLYNLMGTIEPGDDGKLTGRPELGDSRYALFGSGWYWSVESLAEPTNRMVSPSLAGGRIDIPAGVPLDAGFQRQFSIVDAHDQELAGIEAQVILGRGGDIYSFRITGNRDLISEEISSFRRTLILLLSLFGLGFVVASYAIVRIGLHPIRAATTRLAEIRDGRAEKLEGQFPTEIQPLIDETNALIESNRAVIERARTQVGNLAHSLKTPLAVILNESKGAPPKLRKLLTAQLSLMQDQVQTYLDRARIAARHATVISRTPVTPALERLARVIAKLNPGIEFVRETPQDPVFAGETQDFEEIAGNLLENAARFASRQVRVTASLDSSEGRMLALVVEDDGPGMTPQQCEIALKRGTRLDESRPGSGLGLSIAREIASEYGGALMLDRSPLGGLRATVRLPARRH
jgi:signal transduction histidine kinase